MLICADSSLLKKYNLNFKLYYKSLVLVVNFYALNNVVLKDSYSLYKQVDILQDIKSIIYISVINREYLYVAIIEYVNSI
ncbi:hypothetical protein HBI25_084140 [Parastagonospora nodorum]|nr:hypothetical protein HBI25_084140 [Parastagonospora nodorum]